MATFDDIDCRGRDEGGFGVAGSEGDVREGEETVKGAEGGDGVAEGGVGLCYFFQEEGESEIAGCG